MSSLKKKYRLARLGEHPCTCKYKKRGRRSFLHPKNFPPSFKSKTHGFHEFAALGSPFFAFLISFCAIIHLQQEMAPRKLSTKDLGGTLQLKGPVLPPSLIATVSGATSTSSVSRPSKDGRSTERDTSSSGTMSTPTFKKR